ncbi:lactose/L-arabinose transport system substrate-binding protein [Paenibacillus sp. DS2015]|uniref:ABC transporter substrate-binding protein n=1 Tax=Paenibacillus sp. DS2015 TaxID=3373917 RepID=UPI003D24ADA1
MKKILAVLLVSVMMLTACSSKSNDATNAEKGTTEGKSNEITIWAWDPSFNIASLEIAKETYNATNPDVKVNIVEYAQADIIQKLNTGLNSGTTTGLPNIVLIEDFRAQGFISAYPDAFHELTGSINPEDFADYKLGPTSLDGKQYGTPFDSGVTGMYYRTDYLEQAGYTAKDMEDITWDDYIEIGKTVKAKTGKNLITLDPNDLGLIRMMIQSAGSWYLTEDGKTPNIATNDALKEAFTLYKKMMDADIVHINSDWSQFIAALNNGDVATVPTGNWITPSIKAEASQSGKWAVASLPILPENPKSVHASNLGGSSWYVLNAPGSETATDFLVKTFGSNVEMYQKLLDNVGVVSTFKAAASGEAYAKEDEFFSGQKIYTEFAKWTEEIPNINYGTHTYAIDDILVVEMQNYLNGKDIDTVLKDAQNQADTQIR